MREGTLILQGYNFITTTSGRMSLRLQNAGRGKRNNY